MSRGGPSLGIAVGVGVWYVIRLQSYTGNTFRDLVGVGAFVAIIGGLVAVLGGVVALVRR